MVPKEKTKRKYRTLTEKIVFFGKRTAHPATGKSSNAREMDLNNRFSILWDQQEKEQEIEPRYFSKKDHNLSLQKALT
jgi:hypothetical protein